MDYAALSPLKLLYKSRSMLNGYLIVAKNGSFHKSNNIVCFWWKDEKLVE
jgi:hypothetical protein